MRKKNGNGGSTVIPLRKHHRSSSGQIYDVSASYQTGSRGDDLPADVDRTSNGTQQTVMIYKEVPIPGITMIRNHDPSSVRIEKDAADGEPPQEDIHKIREGMPSNESGKRKKQCRPCLERPYAHIMRTVF